MRVAVVVGTHAQAGGARNYEFGVLNYLTQLGDLEIVIFAPRKHMHEIQSEFEELRVVSYATSLARKVGLWLRSSFVGYSLVRVVGMKHSRMERQAIRAGCNLIYFLSPNPLAIGIVDLPMINTVWDLGHRKIPEYPEISGDRHFEEREYYFSSVLAKSVRVVVDSSSTQEDLVRYYGIAKERVLVAGMPVTISTRDLELISKIDISRFVTGRYVVYPAQFWPHKRHVLLLKAFREVLKRHPDLQLVLTGSDKGNLHHVCSAVSALGIEENVVFTGFVDRLDVLALIKGSELLVFPSDLGPTNIPPIEAALLGTQALISKVHDLSVHGHPQITVVPEQTPSCWTDFILTALENAPATHLSVDSPAVDSLPMLLQTHLHGLDQIVREWPGHKYSRRDH